MTKHEHWRVGGERLSDGRGVYAVAFAERLGLDVGDERVGSVVGHAALLDRVEARSGLTPTY